MDPSLYIQKELYVCENINRLKSVNDCCMNVNDYFTISVEITDEGEQNSCVKTHNTGEVEQHDLAVQTPATQDTRNEQNVSDDTENSERTYHDEHPYSLTCNHSLIQLLV